MKEIKIQDTYNRFFTNSIQMGDIISNSIINSPIKFSIEKKNVICANNIISKIVKCANRKYPKFANFANTLIKNL